MKSKPPKKSSQMQAEDLKPWASEGVGWSLSSQFLTERTGASIGAFWILGPWASCGLGLCFCICSLEVSDEGFLEALFLEPLGLSRPAGGPMHVGEVRT